MDRRRRYSGSQVEGVVRKHRPDYQIILYMGLLMLIGLIVMYAIGPQRAQVLNSSYGTDNYSATFFFMKQLFSLGIAVAAFALMAKLPYSLVQRYAKHILIAGLIACVVLWIGGLIGLGFVQCSLGACRWFDLGPLGSLQPAEFLKLAMLIFFAGFLGTRWKQGLVNDFDKTLLPLGIVAGIAVILIIIAQQDMGTGAALLAILTAMFMVAGISKKIGLILLAGLVAAGLLMIVIAPHRMERVMTFFAGDTTTTNDAENYHITHAKIAIGSGGLLGVGIGKSVQATGYLPEAINDSVFAIMGETFGFVGLAVILCLFAALLYRILRVSDMLPDKTTQLIVVGVFGWLGAHVLLNVGAMTGLIPLTGITLPLLSFGGTSMVFIAGALGLVFQLSGYTNHELVKEGERYENSRSGRGLGRPRYTGRRSS